MNKIYYLLLNILIALILYKCNKLTNKNKSDEIYCSNNIEYILIIYEDFENLYFEPPGPYKFYKILKNKKYFPPIWYDTLGYDPQDSMLKPVIDKRYYTYDSIDINKYKKYREKINNEKIFNNKVIIKRSINDYDTFILIKNKSIIDSMCYFYSKLIKNKKLGLDWGTRMGILFKHKDSSEAFVSISVNGDYLIFNDIDLIKIRNPYYLDKTKVLYKDTLFLKYLIRITNDSKRIKINL